MRKILFVPCPTRFEQRLPVSFEGRRENMSRSRAIALNVLNETEFDVGKP